MNKEKEIIMADVIAPAYDEEITITDAYGDKTVYGFGKVVTVDDDKCLKVYDEHNERIVQFFNKDSWKTVELVDAFEDEQTSGEYDSIITEDIVYDSLAG